MRTIPVGLFSYVAWAALVFVCLMMGLLSTAAGLFVIFLILCVAALVNIRRQQEEAIFPASLNIMLAIFGFFLALGSLYRLLA